MAADNYLSMLKPYEVHAVFSSIFLVACSSLYIFRNKKRHDKEVIVFTRYPIPGKAKTRLIPTLGEIGAAKLQIHMTEHMVHTLQDLHKLDKDVGLSLQYNGGTHEQMKYWMDRKRHNLPCVYRPQQGQSLGEKMKLAVQESFKRGNKKVVIIGADIPGINSSILSEALQRLGSCDQNNRTTDMVLGKAEDGGYYLVGFTHQATEYLGSIFVGMDWGTDGVFQQQMKVARDVGASVSVLNTILRDVDTEADIEVFETAVGIPRQQLHKPTWSVIIPVLNEENNITETLTNIVKCCSDTERLSEIIVSDGGSHDNTIHKVQQFSTTTSVPIVTVNSKPGRGNQQIAGATAAKGDNLLFLHADSKLPENYDKVASECLDVPGNVAGAFEFQLDVLSDDSLRSNEPWWFILQMKALVWGTRIRSNKHEIPYGDQALFMTKQTYREVGGFPSYYLMEDYVMVEKLKTLGHIGITSGHKVTTSYRRWRKWGYVRVTGYNMIIIWAYKLGVHPNTLAEWYYGRKIKK